MGIEHQAITVEKIMSCLEEHGLDHSQKISCMMVATNQLKREMILNFKGHEKEKVYTECIHQAFSSVFQPLFMAGVKKSKS